MNFQSVFLPNEFKSGQILPSIQLKKKKTALIFQAF